MILVTGGAGFIGSILAHELSKKNLGPLLIVDNNTISKAKNIAKLKYEKFLPISELFSPDNSKYLNQIEQIFHLGAISSTTTSNWELLKTYNLEFSQKLFHFSAENNIPFIYASSAATYGKGEMGNEDNHQQLEKLGPLNLYAKSKHIFDQWVLTQKNPPPFWAGIKFFNVYGPHEYHKGPMRSMILQAYQQLKETGTTRLFKSLNANYKDGEQLRDFIYVFDVVKVLIKMLDCQLDQNSGIYNLGTGISRSFNDVVFNVAKNLSIPAKIEYFDPPSQIAHSYQYETKADMRKLLSLLPSINFCSLEEGIDQYINKFLEKSDPYL